MKFITLLIFAALVQQPAQAAFISVEGAQTWQSKNDQRIPGEGGDQFSIADFDGGPFLTYRIYAGHVWNDRHELRALYAPLEIEADGEFDKSVRYINGTFAAGQPTTVFYKFNSYRLTYAYHFAQSGAWRWALGFTGKIRDAEVRVKQNALDEKKSNVGFVPLAHARATYTLNDNWSLRFDLDGLAAPQGRAFDFAAFIERTWRDSGLTAFAGYRSVEGGADNDQVYNFAWFHSATLGASSSF